MFSDSPAGVVIPTTVDFADAVARRLVAQHRAELPDLSHLTLVVAAPAMVRPLRLALAHAAGGAVLGPRCITAAQLAAEALPPDNPTPFSALACRLRLAEWLTRLRSVFPDQDPLRLADALYPIFEQLTLNAAPLPDDEAAFTAQLRQAYQAPELAALSREAQIVHRLWRAYTEEISARAPAVAYLAGLHAALAEPQLQYWLGFDELSRAECGALQPAIQRGKVRFWTQGRLEGRDGAALRGLFSTLGIASEIATAVPNPRTALLDACYAESPEPARTRAAALHANGDSGLHLAAAANAEHEAHIVELAARLALLNGARRVAIVSNDRRLARRLRALLEHAELALEDRVGWAVTTSRAGAAFMSWLECLETGFHFRPLLDLLKCGYYIGEPEQRPEPLLAARLEREVLFNGHQENPPVSGLRAFAQAVENAFPAVFERLRLAAAELPIAGPARAGAEWTSAISRSLKAVGLAGGLAEDEAGAQLIAALSLLENALAGTALRLDWGDFRALLERHLESTLYRPTLASNARVALYTLEQTQGLTADALILASATRAQLPGSAAGETFFNQAVRRELGLQDWRQRQAQTLMRLRRVLEVAPSVTVTYAATGDGEPAQLSPWLAGLSAFAEAAGFTTLADETLATRAGTATTQVSANTAALDVHPAVMPQPSAAADRLNFKLSANGHQALIDCPYRFHVRNALQLYAEQAPEEAASRRDYGERVHEILRGFYQQHTPTLPAPYAGPLQAGREDAVIGKLAELADAVFAADLAARPLAKTWRHEFAQLAPWLAEQLIARGDADRIEVEVEVPRGIAGWQLRGVIDRLERRADQTRIVDYKTGGSVPTRDDILSGEAVQLPHYALSAEAGAIEYWNLKDQRLIAVEDGELSDLSAAVTERLQQLHDDLSSRHALPAHGDDNSCSRCEYDGICRRKAWPGAQA
jgi:ATP-dependent helicase/nuclease subunit B